MVIRPSLLSTSDVIQSQPEIIDIKHELDLNTPKSPSGVSETAESDEVMQQEKETENEEGWFCSGISCCFVCLSLVFLCL